MSINLAEHNRIFQTKLVGHLLEKSQTLLDIDSYLKSYFKNCAAKLTLVTQTFLLTTKNKQKYKLVLVGLFWGIPYFFIVLFIFYTFFKVRRKVLTNTKDLPPKKKKIDTELTNYMKWPN